MSKNKVNLCNLSTSSDRKTRSLEAIKKANKRKSKYKKGDYPSSNRYKKDKAFRDGWFGNNDK